MLVPDELSSETACRSTIKSSPRSVCLEIHLISLFQSQINGSTGVTTVPAWCRFVEMPNFLIAVLH